MAPLTPPFVVADATGMKTDLNFSGFLGNRCMPNEIWAVYGGLDRSVVCCGERKSHMMTLDCDSSWPKSPRIFWESQRSGISTNPLKPVVFVKHGNKHSLLAIQSVYGTGSAGSDGLSGDNKVQQMLVDMVRIQVGKVRMTELVDERSQHLRNIADEASFEFDRIAYRTMKGLDATGSRVLRQFDVDAIAIEKELMSARADLEAQSRDFEEFQIRIAYTRNEGLFFKNLYKAPRPFRYQSTLSNKLEEKVAVVTTASGKDASSRYRQLLYVGLSLVMVSFIWSSSSAFLQGTCMRASKLASYGAVISLLLAQLVYVKAITGEADHIDSEE